MPYSMTGMGRASGTIRKPPIKFDVEIKSYNHRFLEISVKCPNCFLPFEDDIRRSVQNKVNRGHIIVLVQQDREILPSTVEIDKPLLSAYLGLVNELKKTHNISGELDINTLLSIAGLIKFSQPQTDASGIYKEFKPILEKALHAFLRMKNKEGKNIAQAIRKSIRIVETQTRGIEKLIPRRNEHYKNHLLDLVNSSTRELNEERFYQELLYAVDKTDVTEECKRLLSHVSLFKDALENEAHPGRKLNFLLQEMQREANTLSVKANFLEISKAVVHIKEEIEKIREQVQNIE